MIWIFNLVVPFMEATNHYVEKGGHDGFFSKALNGQPFSHIGKIKSTCQENAIYGQLFLILVRPKTLNEQPFLVLVRPKALNGQPFLMLARPKCT